MGYRSDVAVAIMFNTKEDLLIFRTKHKILGGTGEQEITNLNVIEYQNKVVAFAYYEDVKWYDSFQDVQAVTKMLEDAQEAKFSTMFIRIGEETADVEHNPQIYFDEQGEVAWDLHDLFSINRSINLPDEAGVEIDKYLSKEV